MSTGRIEADDAWAAIERFFDDGLTDGLPVVPPRSDLVEAALDAAGLAADDTVGVIEPRLLTITAGQVAVNAVMAGCRPEYLPVVVAAVEGMCRGRFNIHGASVSTGGSAQLLIVNGPIRHALGLNSGPNLFGPGFRPNATIGRAIRLVHINVLGNRPGEVDMSCLGHPGKFSFCIAENEELSPWAPLHVEQGFSKDESAVTVINVLSPHQVHSLTNKPLEVVQTRIAEAIADCGHGFGNFVVVLGPEHVAQLEGAGIRAHVDARSERMNAKIRDAQMMKVPYMLVVGDKEAEANGAAVRLRSGGDMGLMPVAEVASRIADEVARRA